MPRLASSRTFLFLLMILPGRVEASQPKQFYPEQEVGQADLVVVAVVEKFSEGRTRCRVAHTFGIRALRALKGRLGPKVLRLAFVDAQPLWGGGCPKVARSGSSLEQAMRRGAQVIAAVKRQGTGYRVMALFPIRELQRIEGELRRIEGQLRTGPGVR
jgi:hypothetical protein